MNSVNIQTKNTHGGQAASNSLAAITNDVNMCKHTPTVLSCAATYDSRHTRVFSRDKQKERLWTCGKQEDFLEINYQNSYLIKSKDMLKK